MGDDLARAGRPEVVQLRVGQLREWRTLRAAFDIGEHPANGRRFIVRHVDRPRDDAMAFYVVDDEETTDFCRASVHLFEAHSVLLAEAPAGELAAPGAPAAPPDQARHDRALFAAWVRDLFARIGDGYFGEPVVTFGGDGGHFENGVAFRIDARGEKPWQVAGCDGRFPVLPGKLEEIERSLVHLVEEMRGVERRQLEARDRRRGKILDV